jgi:hypothetical protein
MPARVGQVQNTADAQGTFAGSGFVVYADDGRPCVTFGYLTHAEANEARSLVEKALQNAKLVQRLA